MSTHPIESLEGKIPEDEWKIRVDLAACYRLVAAFGWDDLIFTHISARVPGEGERFLINPYGMMFDEITASSLVLVNEKCEKLRENPYPVNPAGFVIHSAIHAGRHDVQCVLHTHTVDGVAVSAQNDGLLPISQQATIVLCALAYHGYEGIAVRDDEKARLVSDLGQGTFMILKNHGLLTVGTSVADAFLYMYVLESACRIQTRAQAGGALTPVDPRVLEGVKANIDIVMKGMGGALPWPGLLRKLDRMDPSYRT
ncbi:MAG: class II aldolase/adducin family protein [Sandaracinaceae bacterium]